MKIVIAFGKKAAKLAKADQKLVKKGKRKRIL